jgi:hypothetical protein
MILGSARVSRAGERVLAIANFCEAFSTCAGNDVEGSPFRRNAETSTRDARAPQNSERDVVELHERLVLTG